MTVNSVFSYGHLSDFLKSDFLFHIHFQIVICDFLVLSSQITFVPMHVPFKIHYRNNLIDKKYSYLIPRPPSQETVITVTVISFTPVRLEYLFGKRRENLTDGTRHPFHLNVVYKCTRRATTVSLIVRIYDQR